MKSPWELEVGNLIFFPLLSLNCPTESSCPARRMFPACYKFGVSLGTHQLGAGELERAKFTYASPIIVSCNCR